MNTLADRLREAMAASGISQAELARACGVKPPSVNGWLSQKAKFLRGENLLKAANALGVRSSWLADGLGPMAQDVVSPALPAAATQHSAALTTLEIWRATASPKSVQVIDRLSLLAKKNMLGDEDWQLIDDMVLRLAQRPRNSKTMSAP